MEKCLVCDKILRFVITREVGVCSVKCYKTSIAAARDMFHLQQDGEEDWITNVLSDIRR